MVKVKLRFDNYWSRDTFIKSFQKDIYLIKKIKCKQCYCKYQVILWIDLPYEDGKELIYTCLRKVIAYDPSAFDLCYIKEKRRK